MKKGFVHSKRAEAKNARLRALKTKELKEPSLPAKVNNYKTAVTTVAKGGAISVPVRKELDNTAVVSKSSSTSTSTKRAQNVAPVVNGKVSPELIVKSGDKQDDFIPLLKPKSGKRK